MKPLNAIFRRDLVGEVGREIFAPEGTQIMLDENDFATLDLDARTRQQARVALEELH